MRILRFLVFCFLVQSVRLWFVCHFRLSGRKQPHFTHDTEQALLLRRKGVNSCFTAGADSAIIERLRKIIKGEIDHGCH